MNALFTPEDEIIAVVRGTMLDGRNWRKDRMSWLIENEIRPVVHRTLTRLCPHNERDKLDCWSFYCERCSLCGKEHHECHQLRSNN